MKYVLCAALAVSFIMPGTSLAQNNRTIVVESRHDPVKKWASAVSQDLESRLIYPTYDGRGPTPTGIVTVRFNCAGDGKASNVVVTRHSGDRRLDRAAMYAVSHLKSLHPLPGLLATNQRVQANIFFASSEDQLMSQTAQLRRERAKAVAAGKDDNQTVALNLDVRASG